MLRNQARAARWVARAGYPEEETLLYRSMFDPAWWARVLYVGRQEQVEVWQPEFPGFIVPAWIAKRVLGGRIAVGTHNAEFDRLAQTNDLAPARVSMLRRIEVALLNPQSRQSLLSGIGLGDTDALFNLQADGSAMYSLQVGRTLRGSSAQFAKRRAA